MESVYDLLIFGGGPAGLTAAIYAGRYNMKTLVVAKSFGGTANLAGEVENWPGFMGAGRDLMRTIRMQAERFGAEFLEVGVEKVEKEGDDFVLRYGDKSVRGRSLIIALGAENKKLNIHGEKEFLGKGVSYCATCDGNFFKGKSVAVVGGADSAAKAALYLADICEKVYVVYRGEKMRCENVSLSNICKNSKVEILYNAVPVEVVGENVVAGLGIVIDDNGDKSERVLDVSGIFIEVGAVPVTEIFGGLGVELDDKGYIVTGKNTKTNVDGVFAAGDVTNIAMRQMITAAGEGAVAAKFAQEYLKTRI